MVVEHFPEFYTFVFFMPTLVFKTSKKSHPNCYKALKYSTNFFVNPP